MPNALSAFLRAFGDAGFVAGAGILVQNAFQDGPVNQAEHFFQVFGLFSATGQRFFNGGADGGFVSRVALTVTFGHVHAFFGGFDSRQDAIPSIVSAKSGFAGGEGTHPGGTQCAGETHL